MGIPQYFGWLSRKYKKITYWKDEQKVDYLYFDFNCLIYQVLRELFNAEYAKLKDKPQKYIRQRIIEEVIKYTANIVKNICVPTEQLFIGLDGIVPWAKMNQQRSRRYRSPVLNEWENELKKRFGVYQESIFDTNQITPGTEFMLELGEALVNSVKNNNMKLSKGVKAIISDAFISGEGEHKIMDNMRAEKIQSDKSVCIYGLDADLIMLSLTHESDNIILLRENTYINNKSGAGDLPFMFVSIEEIKTNIFIELLTMIAPKMSDKLQQELINKQYLINDYIFLSFLLGNDFLHSVPSLQIGNGGIDFILQMYCRIFTYQKRYLVNVDDGKYTINHQFLLKIYESLTNSEMSNLKFLQSKKRPPRVPQFDDTYQEEKFKMDRIPLNDRFKKYYQVIDYLALDWKKKYYDIYFQIDSTNTRDKLVINNIINNYLEGLIFTVKYYFEGNPSWNWYNPHPVSPFCSDIFEHLKTIKNINDIQLNKGVMFKPYEQLLMVLPLSSFDILPVQFKKNIDKYIQYKQYYPDSYDFHFEERMMLYSIEPKLPLLNLEDIKELHNKTCKQLSARELLRNETHPIFVK